MQAIWAKCVFCVVLAAQIIHSPLKGNDMECGCRRFRENRIKMQVTGVSYLCGFSEVAKVSGSTVGAAVKQKIYLFNVGEVYLFSLRRECRYLAYKNK